MAERLPLPEISGTMRQDHSEQVLRAQAVANSSNGTNYTPAFSPEFSALSKAMNFLGGGFKIGAGVQNYLNTDKMTKSQKSALSKYNTSAQKVGEAQKNLSDLRGKMADLTGQLNALAQAGCEYASQMSDLKKQIADTQAKADQASKDLASAQAQQKIAQQRLANTGTMPTNTAPARAQKRIEINNAQTDIKNALLGANQSQFEMDVAQDKLNTLGGEYNDLIPAVNENRNQISNGISQMDEYNAQGAQQYANQTNAYNQMGQAMGEAQQAGKDYLNDLKNTHMFDYAGGQLQGWSRAVDSFGKGMAYEGSAQAINQTLSTLSNFSSWTGTGMVLPFVQQVIMSGGQTLQQGGNEVDFGMAVGQATFGLADWMHASQTFNNAIEYANAGDAFGTAVELTNCIAPITKGLGAVYGTGTALAGGAFSGATQLGGIALTATGGALQAFSTNAISQDQLAEAGGSFGAQLALGATSPFYSMATAFGAVADSMVGTNLVGDITSMRGEFVSALDGRPWTDLTGTGVFVPDRANPNDFKPPATQNNPDVLSQLSDPNGVSSRKNNCPRSNYDDIAVEENVLP
jgi:hypothetical protein